MGSTFVDPSPQAEGLGVPKNEKRAAAFFARACEGGDVDDYRGAARAHHPEPGVLS